MRPSRGVIAMAGRLAFDRDGYLYLTLGDRFTPTDGDLTKHVAQDLSNHMGKTVRLHDDGRVPADNPFVRRAGALPEIWSYGHRNAQGMAFHQTTRELWQSESGAARGRRAQRDPPRSQLWLAGHRLQSRVRWRPTA